MENVINLSVDTTYILDLQDDFKMNFSDDLYEFIGKDPVKAFHLGAHIKMWFEDLEPKQQYLYSKQIRHNKEYLEKYKDQIQYWSDKFANGEDVVLEDLSEYILNNMFWDEKTEELDRIKMAFFFGQSIRYQIDKEDDE